MVKDITQSFEINGKCRGKLINYISTQNFDLFVHKLMHCTAAQEYTDKQYHTESYAFYSYTLHKTYYRVTFIIGDEE